MEHVVIFGASRGLGAELARHLVDKDVRISGFARSTEALTRLEAQIPGFSGITADFASEGGQELALSYLDRHAPTRIFCVAAGGPYGPYGQPEWKDHEWAWNLTFKFPARVLHYLAKSGLRPQVILIGSSVAESEADPRAASYSAAKFALRGLYLTLRAEAPEWDVRLFSPGYMDTPLLPSNAAVRKRGVFDPGEVARDLWLWSLTGETGSHKIWPKFKG